MTWRREGVRFLVVLAMLYCLFTIAHLARINEAYEMVVQTKEDVVMITERVDAIYSQIGELQGKLDTIENAFHELVFSIAKEKTGCPVWVLRGLMFAESSYGKNLAHPDPLDKGPFGLHEKDSYHRERAGKWGEYDPTKMLDSAVIAGRIIMENCEILGDMELAISAYRRGVSGTKRNGPDMEYISRVIKGGSGE